MGEIILYRADGIASGFPLAMGPATIGRGAEADLRIDDTYISRKHCQLLVRDDQVVLRDLNSHNGTLVNGQPIQEKVLKPGDKIQLGQTEMMLQLEEKPPAEVKIGEPTQREFDVILRVPPAAIPQPSPSETVRISLPEIPKLKT
jgi:pSer/pThr/pTyr-binding forkhead associated (FHA) protein